MAKKKHLISSSSVSDSYVKDEFAAYGGHGRYSLVVQHGRGEARRLYTYIYIYIFASRTAIPGTCMLFGRCLADAFFTALSGALVAFAGALVALRGL